MGAYRRAERPPTSALAEPAIGPPAWEKSATTLSTRPGAVPPLSRSSSCSQAWQRPLGDHQNPAVGLVGGVAGQPEFQRA